MKETRAVAGAVGLLVCASVAAMLSTGVLVTSATDQIDRPAAERIHTLSEQNLYLTWTVKPTPDGESRISGFIYNISGDLVADVQLRVLELDAADRMLSSSVQTLKESVPPGERTAFVVHVSGHGCSVYQLTIDTFESRPPSHHKRGQ